MKPTIDDEFAVTRADAEAASRKFLNSTLGKELQRLGIDIEESFVRTNFKRLERITSMAREPKEDYNYTLMGRELREAQSSQANRGRRIVLERFQKYKEFCNTYLPTWDYWQSKEFNADFTSKAAIEPLPMAETLSWYNAETHLGDVDDYAIRTFGEHCVAVFNELNTNMIHQPEIKIREIDSWRGRMNWNRNSGHPFWMPISEERYFNVDWPSMRDAYFKIAGASSWEEIEELALKSPGQVRNAAQLIYGMFMRPTDRVIHAMSLF